MIVWYVDKKCRIWMFFTLFCMTTGPDFRQPSNIWTMQQTEYVWPFKSRTMSDIWIPTCLIGCIYNLSLQLIVHTHVCALSALFSLKPTKAWFCVTRHNDTCVKVEENGVYSEWKYIINHDVKGPSHVNILMSTPAFSDTLKQDRSLPPLVHAKRWHQAH